MGVPAVVLEARQPERGLGRRTCGAAARVGSRLSRLLREWGPGRRTCGAATRMGVLAVACAAQRSRGSRTSGLQCGGEAVGAEEKHGERERAAGRHAG